MHREASNKSKMKYICSDAHRHKRGYARPDMLDISPTKMTHSFCTIKNTAQTMTPVTKCMYIYYTVGRKFNERRL